MSSSKTAGYELNNTKKILKNNHTHKNFHLPNNITIISNKQMVNL